MSFFTKWFSKVRKAILNYMYCTDFPIIAQQKQSDDYETILSSLSVDVQKRQTRLSELRLRERRATLLVTLYALSAWVAYIGIWYAGLLPRNRYNKLQEYAFAAPILIGPIL